jgi:hypothetical protein
MVRHPFDLALKTVSRKIIMGTNLEEGDKDVEKYCKGF